MLQRACLSVMVSLFSLLAAASGCAGKTLRVTSVASGATLTTSFPTRVFRASDRNTVDFFLTDLPPEFWRPGADLTGVSGTLVHLHMFIAPEAGKTPLADTASNLTARYLICSRGEFGLYAGGGFLMADGNPLDRDFGGNVSRASLRVIRKSAGFRDVLGAAELSGTFSSVNDPASAGVLEGRVREIADALPEMPTPDRPGSGAAPPSPARPALPPARRGRGI